MPTPATNWQSFINLYAIPTSFVDLFEKTVEAARHFRPLDDDAVQQLQQMATNRESIFLKEEKQVAVNHPHVNPAYPGDESQPG